MNISIVSAMFLPSYGGVERYTDNLARSIGRKGHTVSILTANSFRLSSQESLAEGVTVSRAKCLPLLGGRFPLTSKSSVKQFFLDLKKEPVDLVLIQTRFYPLSCQAAFYCKKYGLPFAVLDHGSGHISFNVPAIDWLVRLYEHAATVLIKARCHNFYGVSLASCEWIKHFGIRAKGALYNSIDAGRIQTIAEETRKASPKTNTSTVITFTGRLIPQKGILKLIKAVEALTAAGEEVELNIAGDGPLKEQIEAVTNPAIHFLGQLAWEDVIRLLAKSDLYVLPSDSEGFPTSVLEAAAAGCYIITTANGGAKEMIISPEYGCILPEATAENLEETIRNCLRDPEGCREAAEKARERVSSEFTWDSAAERLLSLKLS